MRLFQYLCKHPGAFFQIEEVISIDVGSRHATYTKSKITPTRAVVLSTTDCYDPDLDLDPLSEIELPTPLFVVDTVNDIEANFEAASPSRHCDSRIISDIFFLVHAYLPASTGLITTPWQPAEIQVGLEVVEVLEAPGCHNVHGRDFNARQ